MRWMIGAVAALLVAGSALAADAQQPALWTPQGKWVVQFADNECAASRTFVSGSKQIIVAIKPPPASNESRIWFVPDDASLRIDRRMAVIGETALKYAKPWPLGKTAQGHPVYQLWLEADELQKLRSTQKITLVGEPKNIGLSLPLTANLDKVLKTCEADLLKQWGFGPELQHLSAVAKPAFGTLPGFFTVNDYPSSAVNRGAMGSSHVMVTVGTDGRGKACRVIGSSGHEDLDATTCRVLVRRARYTPAKDVSGNPVQAPITATIRWVLPSD